MGEGNTVVDQLKRLTTSSGFNRFILALIVLSGILVGLETYPQFANETSIGQVLDIIQGAILWIFVIEIALKIGACGSRPWEYFSQPWNVFDFVIVAICFLPLDRMGLTDGNLSFASVFRMARILRTLRMVTLLPRLQILVGALLKAIPSLGYVGVLLGLHFYIYAVIGTFMFRANDPIRFGSLHATTSTLFQVLTLEGWNDVRDTQVLGSDVMYDDSWKDKTQGRRISTPAPFAATMYFVSFIMLGTMIMLNLFTGVIISSIEEATTEAKEENREEQLKDKGFLTMHDEMALVSSRLQEISDRLDEIQQKTGRIHDGVTNGKRAQEEAAVS